VNDDLTVSMQADPFSRNSNKMASSGAVLVLLTDDCIQSMSCLDQLHYAYEIDKPLMMVVADYTGMKLPASVRMMLFRRPMVRATSSFCLRPAPIPHALHSNRDS
jgi:hypothetical protein